MLLIITLVVGWILSTLSGAAIIAGIALEKLNVLLWGIGGLALSTLITYLLLTYVPYNVMIGFYL